MRWLQRKGAGYFRSSHDAVYEDKLIQIAEASCAGIADT